MDEWFYFTIHVWVCIYLLFEFKAMLNLLRGRFFKILFFDKQRTFESYLNCYHSGTRNPNCGIQHSNGIESEDFAIGWIWFDPSSFIQFKHHNGHYGNCIYSGPYFGEKYWGKTINIGSQSLFLRWFNSDYISISSQFYNNRKTYIWLRHWSCIDHNAIICFRIFTTRNSGSTKHSECLGWHTRNILIHICFRIFTARNLGSRKHSDSLGWHSGTIFIT